ARAGRAVQAGARDILTYRIAAKVDHAGADRPLGGVLGVRDRDDHVVLVRHRDTVMRSAHADGANLELLVKDGLLRKNTHLVLTVEPLRDIALKLDKMGRLVAVNMNVQQFGVIDVDIAVISLVVEGYAALDRIELAGSALHRAHAFSARCALEPGWLLNLERLVQA